MMLLLLLVLAAIPLLAVVWIAIYGSIFTVDGLFMSLILLAISGIFGLGALLDLRRRMTGSGTQRSSTAMRAANVSAPNGSLIKTRGKIQDVVFYEANVGQPNKSIVTLSDGGSAPQTLVIEGDMRNALPVGQKVEIKLRKEVGQNVLVNVDYA